MSRPRAPIALRMPISRVRSRTETSMMFMIPIPPTSSEIEAMPPRRSARVAPTDENVSRSCAWSAIVKSCVVDVTPCRCWSSAAIVAFATSICDASATLTPIDRTLSPLLK